MTRAEESTSVSDAYHEVSWTPQRVARLWGYYGNSPAHAAVYFSKVYGANILKTLRSWNIPLDGVDIVDFGCGPGHLLQHVLKDCRPQSVRGVEFSKESADRAVERLSAFPAFKGVVEAKFVPVDLPDGCCDVLFLVEVVEHLEDVVLEQTIAEAKRLLRPGGYLVVTTPNTENLELSKTACPDCGCVFHVWQHVRTWTAGSLQAYLEKAGFKTVLSTGTLWQPPTSASPMSLRNLTSMLRTLADKLRGRRSAEPFLAYVGRR